MKKKNDGIDLAFAGAVFKGTCKCHKNQFGCIAVIIDPDGVEHKLGEVFFKTEIEAEKNLDKFVQYIAKEFMAEMGLDPDHASKTKHVTGKAAVKAIRDHKKVETDPKFH